jgi:hypothetical protein
VRQPGLEDVHPVAELAEAPVGDADLGLAFDENRIASVSPVGSATVSPGTSR